MAYINLSPFRCLLFLPTDSKKLKGNRRTSSKNQNVFTYKYHVTRNHSRLLFLFEPGTCPLKNPRINLILKCN